MRKKSATPYHQGHDLISIRRFLGIVISFAAFLVIAIGYVYSDNHYADELILKHKISNPDEAWSSRVWTTFRAVEIESLIEKNSTPLCLCSGVDSDLAEEIRTEVQF